MVLRKALVEHDFPNLPTWMRDADPELVETAKEQLVKYFGSASFKEKYGGDTTGKIAYLTRLVERVKNGDVPRGLCKADFVAAFQVLVDLRLNNKEG